jgi:hypothetical protein
MAQLTEEEFKEQLSRQGFSRVYVWQDGASAFYPEHTHDGLTAHIILDGEMTFEHARRNEDVSCRRALRRSCWRSTRGEDGT